MLSKWVRYENTKKEYQRDLASGKITHGQYDEKIRALCKKLKL